MSPLSKKFSKKYAKELLRVADADLRTAKVLIDHSGGRPENTFFLIQQTVEKALKAVLCHHDLPIPLTHDISALISMMPPSSTEVPDPKALVGLTEYASIRRYEEGEYEYSAAETHAVFNAGKKVLAWAHQIIGP